MHAVRSKLYSIIVFWVLCGCAHFRGLTFQRAAQSNWILITLISILVFPIKTTLHETLLHASTQIQLSYLRFLRSLPIDLPTVSVTVCYVQYFAPTLRVKIFAHTGYGIGHTPYGIRCYVYRTSLHTVIYLNPDRNFAHELTLTLKSS